LILAYKGQSRSWRGLTTGTAAKGGGESVSLAARGLHRERTRTLQLPGVGDKVVAYVQVWIQNIPVIVCAIVTNGMLPV